jgi:hypothetical protein
MRILVGLTLIANVILWVLAIIFGFTYSISIGISLIIGLLSFFIAYRISGGIVTSIASNYIQSEWDVFKRKIKWANSSGITIAFVVYIIAYAILKIK